MTNNAEENELSHDYSRLFNHLISGIDKTSASHLEDMDRLIEHGKKFAELPDGEFRNDIINRCASSVAAHGRFDNLKKLTDYIATAGLPTSEILTLAASMIVRKGKLDGSFRIPSSTYTSNVIACLGPKKYSEIIIDNAKKIVLKHVKGGSKKPSGTMRFGNPLAGKTQRHIRPKVSTPSREALIDLAGASLVQAMTKHSLLRPYKIAICDRVKEVDLDQEDHKDLVDSFINHLALSGELKSRRLKRHVVELFADTNLGTLISNGLVSQEKALDLIARDESGNTDPNRRALYEFLATQTNGDQTLAAINAMRPAPALKPVATR